MPRRRASVGLNQKILENLQRRQQRFPHALAGRTTLLRFSIFSESGLKHCLGCHFLWFVSFGRAKEMNKSIKEMIINYVLDVLFDFFELIKYELIKASLCKGHSRITLDCNFYPKFEFSNMLFLVVN